MPIYQSDPAGPLQVRVYDKHLKKQHKRNVDSRPEAEALLAAYEHWVTLPLAGRPAAPVLERTGRAVSPVTAPTSSGFTVAQWSAEYLERYKRGTGGKPRPHSSWQHDYSVLNAYILPTFADRLLLEIETSELLDFMHEVTRRDGEALSGHTKESIVGTLKRMFKMASLYRNLTGMTDNPALPLPGKWGGQSEERAAVIPSLGDVATLAAAMETLREGLGDAVLLLAYTGMRWEELSALTIHDVDWHDASIAVTKTASFSGGRRMPSPTTKSRAGHRTVPIAPQLVEPLRRLIALGEQRRANHVGWGTERLILTSRTGAPLHYNTWRNALNQAREATGVTYTAHVLRHVAASVAVASGMDRYEVATMMGHANAEYTRRVYAKLWPTDGTVVADKFGAALAVLAAQEQALAGKRLHAVP